MANASEQTEQSGDSLFIDGIAALVAVPPGPLRGAAMLEIETISDAAIWIQNGRIRWFGPSRRAPDPGDCPRLVGLGSCVIPGLIDCHTHIPFTGERSQEFVRRVRGESYLSIMQKGGGIHVTTQAVRRADQIDLVLENQQRLDRMLAHGVTTVECKSGYGLSAEHELRQLRAMSELALAHPIDIVPTYLAAHAVPSEFDGRPDEYLDAVLADNVLDEIKRDQLAVFCDVFCDRGAFTAEQARRTLERAAKWGLRPKLHADELAQIGASRLAGELRAVSADHLEHLDDAGITAMIEGGTIAVVLPGTSFFLGIPHADARRMIAAGLAVAIGTDCNPGSSMIESLPLIMNIACCQLRMLPEEVLAASTANAAAAVARQDRTGAIHEGYDADLVILDAPNLASWFYTPGRPRIHTVIKRGRVVYSAAGQTHSPAPK